MDCDTFYNEDVVNLYKQSPNKNLIYHFHDENPDPIFSYIKINQITHNKSNAILDCSEEQSGSLYEYNLAHPFQRKSTICGSLESPSPNEANIHSTFHEPHREPTE